MTHNGSEASSNTKTRQGQENIPETIANNKEMQKML